MPANFTVTPVDTASVTVTLSQRVNPTYSNQSDVILNTVFLQSLLETGQYYQVVVAPQSPPVGFVFSLAGGVFSLDDPTTGTNVYPYIYDGAGGASHKPITVLGTYTPGAGTPTLTFLCTLQSSTTNSGPWTNIAQLATSTYTITESGTDYTIDIQTDDVITSPQLYTPNGSPPGSISLDGISYTSLGGAIPFAAAGNGSHTSSSNYVLLLPDMSTAPDS